MKTHWSKVLSCILFLVLPAFYCCVYGQEEPDWIVVDYGVRIVEIESGKSNTADIYKNTINGRFAMLPHSENNETMYYIEYSNHPSYKYMFIWGNEFFGRKWYFNAKTTLNLPMQDDLKFNQLIKAYCDSRSGYFRLFTNVVNNNMIIVDDDPFFGYIVYRSDNPRYTYMFRRSGIYWYFTL